MGRRARVIRWRSSGATPTAISRSTSSASAELASRPCAFEIDQPGPQQWKRQSLVDLGFGVPLLRLVPVDFERGDLWLEPLAASGFDAKQPAFVASTDVSMFLLDEMLALARETASAT
jgi:hypothetical protein